MKKLHFILLIILGLITSCDKNENRVANKVSLGIDVQASFNQDNVQIFIDNTEVMKKELQTHPSLGVCYLDGQIKTDLSEGNHTIKVLINNAFSKTETFLLKNKLFIGINFDQQLKEISIIHSDQPFIYE